MSFDPASFALGAAVMLLILTAALVVLLVTAEVLHRRTQRRRRTQRPGYLPSRRTAQPHLHLVRDREAA